MLLEVGGVYITRSSVLQLYGVKTYKSGEFL